MTGFVRDIIKDTFNSMDLFILIWGALAYVASSIGYFGLFRKCAVKGIYAFIPVLREYQLAKCSGREEEGRSYAILCIASFLTGVFMSILGPEGDKYMKALELAVNLAILVFMVRIFSGLCEVFGRNKKWIWALVLLEEITVPVWGWNSGFKPERSAEDPDSPKAAREAGVDVAAEDSGLTVNIKDRTATEMFRKKYLLKDIHLNIRTGEMVLLLGGSGAGKTTFVNALTGYEKANASIILNNEDVYREYSKMKYDVGFVPQQDLMRGSDSVGMTLADAASLRLPSSVFIFDKIKKVDEVLDGFGLGSLKYSLVNKLSGGQKKRLSIAMELISDPSLFILDEPDSGLDGVMARKLFEKLREIADSGKIVVVITHTPDRVTDLFDKVIVLAKDADNTGRLAFCGPVEEAYDFFGKTSMEQILLSVNRPDEGGEGRADEFVEKYAELMERKAG